MGRVARAERLPIDRDKPRPAARYLLELRVVGTLLDYTLESLPSVILSRDTASQVRESTPTDLLGEVLNQLIDLGSELSILEPSLDRAAGDSCPFGDFLLLETPIGQHFGRLDSRF